METTLKIFVLFIYIGMRVLPFTVTVFLLSDAVKKVKVPAKLFLTGSGVCLNALFFTALHFLYYRQFNFLGYLKNIFHLNFYHQDVEYFSISVFVCMGCAVGTGMVLRFLFLGKMRGCAFTKGQERAVIASVTLAFLCIMTGMSARDFFCSGIVINEICSDNEFIPLDVYGLKEDYIELYNDNIVPCRIEGLYLSDDKYNLKKMTLDDVTIEAKGYVVIPCQDTEGSFSINKEGETIYLSDESGEVLEQITLNGVPVNMAYTRVESGNDWMVLPCSAGMENYRSTWAEVETPVLSHGSGFYEEEFQLEIESSPDTTIYYTLDGSIPDEGAFVYDSGIRVYDKSDEENIWSSVQNVVMDWMLYQPDKTKVDKAFIVRAVAVDQYSNRSDVITATYFVNCEQYADKKIISLVADPEVLFGENGIYVTGKEYDDWYTSGQEGDEPLALFRHSGRESEREAEIEMFEEAESLFKQEIGIRINGASTRKTVKKRFSLYARSEYSGSDRFELPFFEDGQESHSVVLRESLADVICQGLVEERGICMERGIPVTVFLNGEYWYDVYLRDKYSTTFFEDYYGIEKSNLVTFKAGELDEGLETDVRLYNQLYEYLANNDLSKEEHYSIVSEMMDIQNYIDYIAINVYLNNMDIDDKKNIVMWRSREDEGKGYNDGRWRWALHDMDWIARQWENLEFYGTDHIAKIDSFSEKPRYAEVPVNQLTIYKALRSNAGFNKQFVLTFMDLLNTYFALDAVTGKLATWGEDITWMESYFEKRPEYMISYLAKEFGLKGTVEKITLCNADDTQGTIQLNTINPEMENGFWTGRYFTDYPVSVQAVPKQGYEFAGWSGDIVSMEETLEIKIPNGGIRIKAEFKKAE